MEINPQIINKRIYTCRGNAGRETAQDEPTTAQPRDKGPIAKPGPSIKDRTPQFTKSGQDMQDAHLPDTTEPHPDGIHKQPKGANGTEYVAEEIAARKEHEVDTANQHGGPYVQTDLQKQQPENKGPTGHDPVIQPRQAKEIEVTISVRANAKISTKQYQNMDGDHKISNTTDAETTPPATTLEIRVTNSRAREDEPNENPLAMKPAPRGGPTTQGPKLPINNAPGKTDRTSTETRGKDRQTTDWYSLVLQDEDKENIEPKETNHWQQQTRMAPKKKTKNRILVI